ncbi:S41 family peptidase [Phycisphaera mikurensis]|uniref:Putative carboxy-terminal-processing protease n=1 Tax=Phycisphaera mikurensis (strain NBRC 102666 / KCTC 22515 / FYK2301M01) TaxID=1142394 RepID=I0IDY9_PHYMF|nr:S41 family peptidase [Phycisphaera mikurensis]MBB6441284.1 carboxyl-terminal processing protease [Phycisphaera mikurensis]BAM03477.1 putative carboxy-terminal-processing protease [Phycisphaera mikurensis NBRC 102666]
MKRSKLATNLSLAAVALVLTVALHPTWARSADTFDEIDLFVTLRHDLLREYVEEPDSTDLIEGGVKGMIEALNDPYTAYMTAEEFEDFNKHVSGSFSGIGAEVQIDATEKRLQIVSPLEDSPAWNQGVQAGDIVMTIDGEDTFEMSIIDAVKKLTGEEGTDVTIVVRHEGGETEEITITRARIKVDSVKGFASGAEGIQRHWIDPEAKIAYLRLTQFNENSVGEVRDTLRSLVDAGMKGLVFDMRFNPGGLLDAAEAISDMFLDGGQTIVSVRGRAVRESTFTSTPETLVPEDVAVVVLANEASASAAEIVAGALSENGRSLLVGTRTFGKGSVQQLKVLDKNLGALKITNAYYYLPSGRNIHRRPILGEDEDIDKEWGVDPTDGDYVPMTRDEIVAMLEARRDRGVQETLAAAAAAGEVDPAWILENLSDPQLAAALTAIEGKLETGEFPQVGQKNADAVIAEQERANLVRAKEQLQEQLARVNEELEGLQPETIGSAGLAPVETVSPEARAALEEAAEPADANAGGGETEPAAAP